MPARTCRAKRWTSIRCIRMRDRRNKSQCRRAAKTQLTSYPMVRRAARKPAAAQAPAATKFRGTHATVTVQPMGGEARQGLDRLLHDAPLSVDHLDSARERPPAAGNRR